jgi:hypothetical protein
VCIGTPRGAQALPMGWCRGRKRVPYQLTLWFHPHAQLLVFQRRMLVILEHELPFALQPLND